jgi:hypothetical protein
LDSTPLGEQGSYTSPERDAEDTMNTTIECILRQVLIGTGATAIMDLWGALLRRFGIPSLNLAFLGRWVGHLFRGRWHHEGIAKSTPVRGEQWIGWSAHYGIGVGFAALLLLVFGLDWARSPTLGPALLVGVVTVIAPLFVLQPALGAGVASTKTPRPVFNSVKSLVSHTVFGFGLFLAAEVVAWVVPAAQFISQQ